MTEVSGGEGTAANAMVSTEDKPMEGRISLIDEAKNAVVAANRAVEKAEAQLKGAKEAVAAARAALKEVEG